MIALCRRGGCCNYLQVVYKCEDMGYTMRLDYNIRTDKRNKNVNFVQLYLPNF